MKLDTHFDFFWLNELLKCKNKEEFLAQYKDLKINALEKYVLELIDSNEKINTSKNELMMKFEEIGNSGPQVKIETFNLSLVFDEEKKILNNFYDREEFL